MMIHLNFKSLLWENLHGIAHYLHQQLQTKTCGHFLTVKMAL